MLFRSRQVQFRVSSFEFLVAKAQRQSAGKCEASRSLILCPLSFVLCPLSSVLETSKPETRNQEARGGLSPSSLGSAWGTVPVESKRAGTVPVKSSSEFPVSSFWLPKPRGSRLENAKHRAARSYVLCLLSSVLETSKPETRKLRNSAVSAVFERL